MKRFHVVIIAPGNYPHSAAFSEIAESVLLGLKSLGFETGFAFNEFAPDAVNIVFGAHLISRESMAHLPDNLVIYNTEQADENSAWLKTALPDLIRKFETWDYSRRNIERLSGTGRIRHVPIGYMPQLSRIEKGVEDLDVLFYGSLNERRMRILEGLRERGLRVEAAFNVYGEERDRLISRAKVVLNVHYYESKIFEIVRISYLLANRKAVVSEVGPDTDIDPIYLEAVAGVPYDALIDTCVDLVLDNAKRKMLEERGFGIMSSVREENCLRPVIEEETMLPKKINLGSGKNFMPDFLNIDINDYWKPDIVADLSRSDALSADHESARFGNVRLEKGSFDRIEARDVLEHVPDLATLMTHCLELLREGGEFFILVPYDLSYGAWQDPTHVRAFNERSWLYYTDWFWYLGWREARFDVVENTADLSELGKKMHDQGVPLSSILLQPRAVDAMRVTLRKRSLNPDEKLQVEQYLKR